MARSKRYPQAIISDVREDKNGDPYLLVMDHRGDLLNRFNTMQPTHTLYAEQTYKKLNQRLRTAGFDEEVDVAFDYLDRIDPISEDQLRSIFPKATATKMKDPLTIADKTIIHDNVRRDGPTKRGLFQLSMNIMGKDPNITLDVSKRFATEERKKIALQKIMADDTNLTILEGLMDIDDKVNIYDRELELVFSGNAYGRSCCLKQLDKHDRPINLLPLPSTRLGRVWVDKKTQQFLGVEYLDYPTSKRILQAKDIIYYTVDDYQISPNSRYFGMPLTEPSMYVAQSNRVANEITKPEVMARYWAPLVIVKSQSRSRQKLEQLRSSFIAGKTTFINSDVDIQVVPLPTDLKLINDTLIEQSKQVFRDMTVPLVVAYQDEQNRATAESSLQQWYDGPLAFKRNHLNTVMWYQWYKPQLQRYFDDAEEVKQAAADNLLQYKIDLTKGLIERPTIPFKIRIVFTNIRAAGFLDLFKGLLAYNQAGIINNDICRIESGLGQYNETMHQEELMEQQQSLGEAMFTNAENAMNAAFGVQDENVPKPSSNETVVNARGQNRPKDYAGPAKVGGGFDAATNLPRSNKSGNAINLR